MEERFVADDLMSFISKYGKIFLYSLMITLCLGGFYLYQVNTERMQQIQQTDEMIDVLEKGYEHSVKLIQKYPDNPIAKLIYASQSLKHNQKIDYSLIETKYYYTVIYRKYNIFHECLLSINMAKLYKEGKYKECIEFYEDRNLSCSNQKNVLFYALSHMKLGHKQRAREILVYKLMRPYHLSAKYENNIYKLVAAALAIGAK
jgi:hypothetical protein